MRILGGFEDFTTSVIVIYFKSLGLMPTGKGGDGAGCWLYVGHSVFIMEKYIK